MAYHERDKAEQIDALSQRYRDGEFSADVYRASLYAIGKRGDAITDIVRTTQEAMKNDPRESRSHRR